MSKYISRLIEEKIKICLKIFGAINIVGPRYCGKTTTSIELSKSSYYFDSYTTVQLENILKYKPENILEGDYPRLIDEWQRVPRLWDITRFWVDQKKEAGLYLLTNSVRVDRSTIVHCGAGRIVQLEMDTMSLYESNNSEGQLSLKELFDNPKIEGKIVSTTKMDKIGYFICRGGWPELISIENNKIVLDISFYQNIIGKYVDSIINFENYSKIPKLDKNKKIISQILVSISKMCSTQIKVSNILKDIENKISRNTLNNYLMYLKDIYILNEVRVWHTRYYKSKTKLASTPKTYFCDPSIALYLLGINHKNIFGNMQSFKSLFENLVMRDLKVYMQSMNGNIYFFRDKNDFEVDAILETNDGRWTAIEIKLGKGYIEDAAKNLLRLKEKTNKPPAFLAVITAYEFAYQREDGVLVIPIQCLKN